MLFARRSRRWRITGQVLVAVLGLHVLAGPMAACAVVPSGGSGHAHHDNKAPAQQDLAPHGDCCGVASCCFVVGTFPAVTRGSAAVASTAPRRDTDRPVPPSRKLPRLLPPAVGPPHAE